ncbi:putative folate-biopterin transporter 4 [Bidens hawaiensis]|uniref:putative folate-biopterin transporter 4 n=1 Tax=Bidens hawaiensis TaxID=980011 RepID=UPI00404AE2B2
MIGWLKQLRFAFGASFIWLVCLIYFTQGFRSFVWTAVSYQLKDKLKLSPSASQLVTSVAFFPWSIKPIYGILSDCIPIKGKKRIPYLVIATLLSLFPWVIIGLQENIRNSRDQLMIFLLLQNLGSAMADVVIDAMIAEAARLEKAKFAGDLQSVSWMAMALGGICGSLLGGYALSNFQMENIFLVFAVLPAVQLLSCVFVNESSESCEPKVKLSTSNDTNGIDGTISDEDESLVRVHKTKSLRRNKSSKQKKKKNINRSNDQMPEKDVSLSSQLLQSLKTAGFTLFKAFRQPIIFRPMAWFFLAQVTMPNLSTVMFYYQTEVLNLEASFLGTTRVIGWIGLMIGTFIYNRFLKRMKLRRILMFAHVTLALITLLDIVLVTRLNVSLGVSDKTMMLFGSVISDAINQFKFMPFLVLSGHLCPPGIEGTLFALFMSINNLGATISGFLGAGLASVLNISSGSFDNLSVGIAIQVICTFLPVGFLFLIPEEATGVSA